MVSPAAATGARRLAATGAVSPSRIAVSVSGQRVRVGGSGVVAAEGSLIV